MTEHFVQYTIQKAIQDFYTKYVQSSMTTKNKNNNNSRHHLRQQVDHLFQVLLGLLEGGTFLPIFGFGKSLFYDSQLAAILRELLLAVVAFGGAALVGGGSGVWVGHSV